jgi:hypothetical protein
MGDSWGTISPATDEFKRELNEHKCPLQGFTNIAIGGTTAQQWAEPKKMLEVKKQAKDHDLVWVTLMGNDALAVCPDCAKAGKTAEECGDELTVKATGWMTTIIDGIHEANPNAKVMGEKNSLHVYFCSTTYFVIATRSLVSDMTSCSAASAVNPSLRLYSPSAGIFVCLPSPTLACLHDRFFTTVHMLMSFISFGFVWRHLATIKTNTTKLIFQEQQVCCQPYPLLQHRIHPSPGSLGYPGLAMRVLAC